MGVLAAKAFFSPAAIAVVAISMAAALVWWPGRASAWELHNRSSEEGVFDEYRDGSRTPYAKTVRPGGMASFHNNDRVTVVDRRTGLKVSNPGYKHMEITKEGGLRPR